MCIWEMNKRTFAFQNRQIFIASAHSVQTSITGRAQHRHNLAKLSILICTGASPRSARKGRLLVACCLPVSLTTKMLSVTSGIGTSSRRTGSRSWRENVLQCPRPKTAPAAGEDKTVLACRPCCTVSYVSRPVFPFLPFTL